jgi:antitoxin component of RelBE/YafQ-DinJ toxin-antitoxin module
VKAQFNVRIDAALLERFRAYCHRNGLDPTAQIEHFMRRIVDSDFDFQEKLWEVLLERRRD